MSCEYVRRGGLFVVLALAIAWAPARTELVSAQAKTSADSKSRPAPGDAILGEWWTEKRQGRIKITRSKDGTYLGTTTCCTHENDPENPSIDLNNPNPAQRKRSTLGIIILWKLKYEDGEYVDGYVYNPRDGKTYRLDAELVDRETLKIRGYVGIALLGQSQTWKRAHAKEITTKAPK